MFCKGFSFHEYTDWKVKKDETYPIGFFGEHTHDVNIVVQRKTCTKCGKVKQRKIETKCE